MTRTNKCPRCESPAPNLHPAVQSEGEVQMCSHPWHGPVPDYAKHPSERSVAILLFDFNTNGGSTKVFGNIEEWEIKQGIARILDSTPTPKPEKCTCEGEFPEHCGPECDCWHHDGSGEGGGE